MRCIKSGLEIAGEWKWKWDTWDLGIRWSLGIHNTYHRITRQQNPLLQFPVYLVVYF